jgi:diadenosine tetraphosphate (Ap4A) HIT family hydrolase
LQYYKYITKVMPGRVLRSHNVVTSEGDEFTLNIAGGRLSSEQIQELVSLCNAKIDEYETKYGRKSIWHSRFAGAKDISGPLQYEVLKRAKERCELCGISKNKALQVDHIVPRSKGGLTVLENLQALCYTCNAQKQNKDDTDFRDWPKLYSVRDKDCVFCKQESSLTTIRNSLAMAFEDKYPVTKGHMLVTPLRHTPSFFELGASEQKACLQLLENLKQTVVAQDPKVTGFNVGINDGIDAGQTVMHCHIHLIPRRKGDVADPRGGIRHIIPNR